MLVPSSQITRSAAPGQGPGAPSVLDRLSRLEKAIFGSETVVVACEPLTSVPNLTSQPYQKRPFESYSGTAHDIAASSPDEVDRRQAAKQLDLGLTNANDEPSGSILNGRDSLQRERVELAVRSISDSGAAPQQAPARSFALMTAEEAHTFLADFVDNPIHLLPLIHHDTCQSMIRKLYESLKTGNPLQHQLAYASLVLAIAATSAFLYHPESGIHGMFDTPEHAARISMQWMKAALELVDLSQYEAPPCTEAVQARVVLANLLYSIEGCSSRYRFTHHNSVLLGRELGLHLLDSPRTTQQYSVTEQEVKRRLWWYIVSTDW